MASSTLDVPLPYALFFLYIEPVMTLLGFLSAWFTPSTYLHMTHPLSAPLPDTLPMPTATLVALRQLGNLYFTFALSEALVLRFAGQRSTWRAFLFVLLVADFGHVLSVAPVATSSLVGEGWSLYYNVTGWNAMMWGNLGFVYVGALTRICFLTGVGMDEDEDEALLRIVLESVKNLIPGGTVGKGKRGKKAAKKPVKKGSKVIAVDGLGEEMELSVKELSKSPAMSTRQRTPRS